MKSHRNLCIDILKFISSCFIIFIHISLPGRTGSLLDCMARFAVPFFFSVSGYYAYNASTQTILIRMKRIIRLFILSNMLYFIYELIIRYLYNFQSISEYILNLINIRNIALFIFMQKNLIADHLWYLLAMILVYLFYLVYCTFFKDDKINYFTFYLASFLALLIHILAHTKFFGVDFSLHYLVIRDAVYFGLPMFALGMFLNEYSKKINDNYEINNKKLTMYLIIGFALSIIQWFGFGKVELPLGMIIVDICLILLCVNNKLEISEQKTKLVSYLGKISTYIYIIHPLIDRAINILKELEFIRKLYTINPIIRPLFVLLTSIIISSLYLCVRRYFKKLINQSE